MVYRLSNLDRDKNRTRNKKTVEQKKLIQFLIICFVNDILPTAAVLVLLFCFVFLFLFFWLICH